MANKPYHHGDLKRELIREGRCLLNDDGYEGFSLRKLSRRLGVSAAAPYRHFRTKEALCEAIVDDAFSKFADALESSESEGIPLREQLLRMCIRYIRFFVEHPDILKILFIEVGNRDATLTSMHPDRDLAQTYRNIRAFSVLSDLAERIAGEEPQVNADELVLTAWSRVHGLAVLLSQETWLIRSDNVTDDALRRMIRTVL